MPKLRRSLRLSLVAAGALGLAARLFAQAIPVDVELGYRFVDVSGNDQEYRTQINDRPGVLLRSLDFTGTPEMFGGLLDTLHVDASDVGAGPAGQLRFVAGQNNVFKLSFTWRETDLYSALPAFANPFIDDGIVPGQQTWNRIRNIYDVTLELLPGKIVTPLLGYTRNTYDGPGTTTYHLGENEFQLDQQVESIDELYRVGLGFNYAGIQAGFTQGWRQYRWKSIATLTPGAGDGNVTTPDPRPEHHGDHDRRVPEQQGQHSRHQRVGHGNPFRPHQARSGPTSRPTAATRPTTPRPTPASSCRSRSRGSSRASARPSIRRRAPTSGGPPRAP